MSRRTECGTKRFMVVQEGTDKGTEVVFLTATVVVKEKRCCTVGKSFQYEWDANGGSTRRFRKSAEEQLGGHQPSW